jgi:hypothetical protein
MGLFTGHGGREDASAGISIGATQSCLTNRAWAELFDLVRAADTQDTSAVRLLRSLLDENRQLRATNSDLAATLNRLSPASPPKRFTLKWINSKPDEAKAPARSAPSEPLSWQDVHCQDTSWWVSSPKPRQETRRRALAVSLSPEPSTSALELRWIRQNSALVYLLRTGQWQPVPSSPPDTWVERLGGKFSGITLDVARRILTVAFETVPQPAKVISPEPLSNIERHWAGQNSPMVRGLFSGQLRGIPTSPSRAWVTAFQSAVGGTVVEISAILAVVTDIARQFAPH